MSGKIRIYMSHSFKKGMLCVTPRYHSKDTASVSVVSQIWDINKNGTGAHDNIRQFSLQKLSFRCIRNLPLGDIYTFIWSLTWVGYTPVFTFQWHQRAMQPFFLITCTDTLQHICVNVRKQKHTPEVTATAGKGKCVTSQSQVNTLVGFKKVKWYC